MKKNWLPFLLLGLGVMAFYLPSALQGSFLNWDDDKNFLENPLFRMGFVDALAHAVRNDRLGNFQPLAWLLLWAETLLFGLSPKVILVMNVVLHAANTLILFSLGRRFLAKDTAPWLWGILALGFAVHPLRVEVVAWASCQPILWSTLFSLLSLAAFLRHLESGRPVWPSAVLFACAVLCKSGALGLPPFFLLLRYLKAEKPTLALAPGFLRKDAAFWAIALVAGGFALKARDLTPALQSSVIEKLLTPFTVLVGSLFTTVWPWQLSPIYPTPSVEVSLAVVAVTVALGILVGFRGALLPAALAYLAVLFPQMASAITQRISFADRYTYLAGGVLLLFLARWITRPRIVALTVLLLAIGSFFQLRAWRDSESLWKTALERAGASSFKANSNLGALLLEQKRLDEAKVYLERARRLDPASPAPYNGLGVVSLMTGNPEEARRYFEKALAAQPRFADAMNNLATLEPPAEALRLLDRAVSLEPKNPKLREHRARTLEALERPVAAAEDWRHVVDRNPSDTLAVAHLGALLERLGKRPEAIARFREAARLSPRDPSARFNLAVLLADDGKREEAEALLKETLSLAPDFAPAREELSRLSVGPK